MSTEPQPWELLFGGLEQLGPGSDESTRQALARLPRRAFARVVDAGCGAGRQTLVLARELGVPIEAVDTHQPFLDHLTDRAARAGLAELVRPSLLDMAELPTAFAELDLIWSEGAVYNVGFQRALQVFARVLQAGGCVALTECTWLTDDRPAPARDFFQNVYPAMTTIGDNCQAAAAAGFRVLDTFPLPSTAWTEGYYDPLRPRAQSLLQHADLTVRACAAEALHEIEVFEQAGNSYGYVFYLLEYPGADA